MMMMMKMLLGLSRSELFAVAAMFRNELTGGSYCAKGMRRPTDFTERVMPGEECFQFWSYKMLCKYIMYINVHNIILYWLILGVIFFKKQNLTDAMSIHWESVAWKWLRTHAMSSWAGQLQSTSMCRMWKSAGGVLGAVSSMRWLTLLQNPCHDVCPDVL